MLAITPLLRAEDRCNMDGQLVNWYNSLPWLLRTTDPCAEPLYIARCIMKWRYQNLRMLLHRPVLLSMASSGLTSHVTEEDVVAVETCRELAKATIEDIAREWTRNQMSGWNAVWFLYQAAMIPLVSIFWEWDSPQAPEWRKQIETILELLDAMEDWSLAARRSREVVWRMYEASRQPSVLRGGDSMQGVDTEQGLLMDEADFHMSPIGLETDDMVGMLDQHGLWDLDGMHWGHGQVPTHADNSMYGVDEGLVHMDYASIGIQGPAMDSNFFMH